MINAGAIAMTGFVNGDTAAWRTTFGNARSASPAATWHASPSRVRGALFEQALMPAVDFAAGATVISVGQERDDRVFFIEDGEVSVVLGLSDDSHQRIATLCGGMTFGEMATLGMPARSASVHADTAVRCRTSKAEALDQLAIEHPEIKIAVLKNLSLDLAQKLRQANLLIGALAA